MTYHDEIVAEVRDIREQLCNQAGSLDNLLATLRAEEAKHPGRMAKHVSITSRAVNSDIQQAYLISGKQKIAISR
ncbi:MAG: hypothetical protein WCP20_20370 [Desulfuromonadales bacterium]